jgi:tetratricopeptide (TPR) repeat protein
MSLRRFTDKAASGLVVLAMLAVAGCAGPGPSRDEPAPAGEVARPVVGAAVERIVPPEALTQFEQATAVMAAGDFVDAELRFKEFVQLYPQYPALQIDPNYAAALNQLGMLLRRNGNFLEAEAAYMKAVTVSPDYALAHYNLGVLNELYLQRLETALQHFETYQSLVGEDKQVEKWISDLRRRVAADKQAANVAE